MSKTKQQPTLIRDIDRTNDYRVICEKCSRDFGGTVAPIVSHQVRLIICPSCQFGSVENQMRAIEARLNDNLSSTNG